MRYSFVRGGTSLTITFSHKVVSPADEVSPLLLHSCQQLETLMLLLLLVDPVPLVLDQLWQFLAGTLISLPPSSPLSRLHIIIRPDTMEYDAEDDEHDGEPEPNVGNSWDTFAQCLQRFQHLSAVDIDLLGDAVNPSVPRGPTVDLHPTLADFFGQTADELFPASRTYDATIRILDDDKVDPRYDL